MTEIATVDTSVFARCSRLIEDSKAAAEHWTKLREEIKDARTSVGRLAAGTEEPAEKVAQYAAKIAALEARNETLEKRNEELEQALAKSEAAAAHADEDLSADRAMLAKETAKIEKDRVNIRKDAEKLRDYNRSLEKAKHALEKREAEIRAREKEIESTVDYFAVHLAPTEQKVRPQRGAGADGDVVPLPSIPREPSCLPHAASSTHRWKRSRMRQSVVPSDSEEEDDAAAKKPRKQ